MAFDFLERKSIFDILNEAEDDDTSDTQDTNNDTNDSDTNIDNGDNNDQSNNDDNDNTPDEGKEDFGSDDDFDIDSSLDDNEDNGSNDSSSSDSSAGSSDNIDEEPVKSNTDIFTALTKEEQAIKIKELKRLYNELYLSCDDMLDKINDINADEDTLIPLEKISSAMYSLKTNIGDYIQMHFASKSYIENDVMFNRYLIIMDSIKKILNQISSELEEKLQKGDKN